MTKKGFLFLAALVVTGVLAVARIANAFRQDDMDKLNKSKQCPKCDFSDAKFWGVQLVAADLSGANLSRANLGRSNLTGANLKGALLVGTNLKDANLSNATWVDGRTCKEGSLGECVR